MVIGGTNPGGGETARKPVSCQLGSSPQSGARPKMGGGGGVARLLSAIFLSGMTCFRLGRFSASAPSWIAETQAMQSHLRSDEIVGGVDCGDPDGAGCLGVSRPARALDPDDRRSVLRSSLPYNCGVVFFYHIPCAGGTTIDKWFKKYQKPEFGNISYYTFWSSGTRKDGSFHPDPEKVEAKFASGMSQHIQDLGPNEWRIAHSHLASTYMNESEDILHKWRADVEAQGCELINTIMLRDPLNHAMSLYKIIDKKNSTREEWTRYLSSPTGPGLWATVLDFFLYNNQGARHHKDYPNGPGGRNPFNVTKEVKVAHALELLHRHFDVVTVADHATFMDTILSWTGWPPIPMPTYNIHRGSIPFTKKEVENLQKLLQKNGDIDFVDQVKREYHGYLSYLENEQ